jgi:hypothetical protein
MDLRGGAMYVTTRHYSGLDRSALDEIVRRREEIEAFVKGRPGLRHWYAVGSGDGMTTVTISEDQQSADETVAQVAAWVRENLPTFLPNPPEVRMGEVIAETSNAG